MEKKLKTGTDRHENKSRYGIHTVLYSPPSTTRNRGADRAVVEDPSITPPPVLSTPRCCVQLSGDPALR